MGTRFDAIAQRRRRLTAVVGLAALVTAAAACSSSGGSGGKTYELGGIYYLSGPSASLGEAWQAGLQAGIDEINKAGGVNGKKLHLNSADDQSGTPSVGTAAYRNMVSSKKVYAVLGFTNGSVAAAVAPLAEQLKVPVIGTGFGSPFNSMTFASSFDPYGTIVNELPLVKYLAQKANITRPRVVTIASNTAVGLQSTKNWKAGIKGTSIVDAQDRNEPGSLTQYGTQAAEVASAHPDIVAMSATQAVSLIMVKAIRQAGFKGPIVNAYYGASDATFKAMNDPNFYVYRDYADPVSPAAANMIAVAKSFGIDATNFVEGNYFTNAYVMTQMIKNVLEACGKACTQAQFAKTLTTSASKVNTDGLAVTTGFSSARHAYVSQVQYYQYDPQKKIGVPVAGLPTAPAFYGG